MIDPARAFDPNILILFVDFEHIIYRSGIHVAIVGQYVHTYMYVHCNLIRFWHHERSPIHVFFCSGIRSKGNALAAFSYPYARW